MKYRCLSCGHICNSDKCMGFCPNCGRDSLEVIE